jgi:hypothetical protein
MTGSSGSNSPEDARPPTKCAIATSAVGRGQAIPGAPLPCPAGSDLEGDVLEEASRRVKKTRGTAGVDAMMLAAVERSRHAGPLRR